MPCFTLGYDVRADAAVSELARIVEMSGGQRHSCAMHRCKDFHEAIPHTNIWFCGGKSLLLVYDI